MVSSMLRSGASLPSRMRRRVSALVCSEFKAAMASYRASSGVHTGVHADLIRAGVARHVARAEAGRLGGRGEGSKEDVAEGCS